MRHISSLSELADLVDEYDGLHIRYSEDVLHEAEQRYRDRFDAERGPED